MINKTLVHFISLKVSPIASTSDIYICYYMFKEKLSQYLHRKKNLRTLFQKLSSLSRNDQNQMQSVVMKISSANVFRCWDRREKWIKF